MSVRTEEIPRPLAPIAAQDRQLPLWLVLAVPAALAALLSIYQLAGRSLGFDEAATYAIASQHGSALWRAIAHDGGNMSAYYLLMHGLTSLFGGSVVVLRLPSVAGAVAVAALVAAIGDRMFDRRAGMIAGVLAAVSLPVVYWAQTARGYALMLAFVCGAFLAFLSLADPVAGRRSGRGAWIAYVVCTTVACYCSFVAVLVVPVQVAALVRRPAALRRLAGALVAVAVLCIPLVVLAVHRGSGQLFWVPRPSSMVDTQVLESITSAGLEPSFHRTAMTNPLIVITLVTLGVLLVGVAWGVRRSEPVWPVATAIGWFAFPVVVTFVYSLFFQSLFEPRNVLTSVPAVAVALGVGLADRRVPKVLALVVVAVIIGLRAEQVAVSYGVSPEPWRAATRYVMANSRPGDCVAFYPEDGRSAFQYYVRRQGPAAEAGAPRSILPVLGWSVVRPYVEQYVMLSPAAVRQAAAGCRRMWFVSSHEGELTGTQQSRANRAHWHQLGAELARVFGSAPVRKFGYASTIHIQLLPGR